MKQGSTDDPFADDTTSDADTDTGTEETATAARSDSDSGSEAGRLPYIYARDSVKDGRQQRPIFLRDEIEDGIPELVGELEARFDENVYRTDVMEAAVEVAQEHPDLLEAKLEEWGYGWD